MSKETSSVKSAPRAALPFLLAANLIAITVLGTVTLMSQESDGERPSDAPPMLITQLAPEELEETVEVLRAKRSEKQRQVDEALWSENRDAVAHFVSLQVIAADMRVVRLNWSPPKKDKQLEALDLEVQVKGTYYNLPILLNGLYRQSRPIQITYVSVESPRATAVQTAVLLRIRFYRPPEPNMFALQEAAEALAFAGQTESTLNLLLEAARIENMKRFKSEIPRLWAASKANHKTINTTVPLLLRKLPQSPLGWMGLELRDGELNILNQP